VLAGIAVGVWSQISQQEKDKVLKTGDRTTLATYDIPIPDFCQNLYLNLTQEQE